MTATSDMEHRTRTDAARRSVQAVREISRALLAGDSPTAVLALVAEHAGALVGADLTTIVVPTEDPVLLEVRAAVGRYAESVRGQRFPRRASLSGRVMDSGHALNLPDAALEPAAHQPIVALGRFGPALLVPLVVRGKAFGTLVVTNRHGGSRFTSEDLDLVELFAEQAALVLDSVRAEEALLAITDRERVGRDLHDTVIQRLFATGMTLESLRARSLPPETETQVGRAVDDLDATIREIRTKIFPFDAP